MGKFLMKYRNLLLLGVLVATMIVSYYLNQEQLAIRTSAVTIPITGAPASSADALSASRQRRDETALADMAALQALCEAENVDETLRQDAALRLAALVDTREKQQDLEEALTASGIAPCVAVLSPGCVTIATEKKALTQEEQALALTLAGIHAGVQPSGVRIICADE